MFKKIVSFIFIFLFNLNLYAVEKGVTPSIIDKGDSFQIYFNADGNLPSGNDVRISLNGSSSASKLDGGPKNWYKDGTASTVGDYTVEFKWYQDDSFKQSLGTSSFSIIDPIPSTPSLSSPSDNAELTDTTPTLSWNSVSGATYYKLALADVDGNKVYDLIDVTSTSKTTSTLSKNIEYRWAVKACNDSGCSSASSYRAFTVTDPIPSTPSLSSPSDNAELTDTTPTLSWNSVSGATYYKLALADVDGNKVYDLIDVTSTSKTTSTLSKNIEYRWAVKACNDSGCSSASSYRAFTVTDPIPSTPSITNISVSPDTGTKNDTNFTFNVDLNDSLPNGYKVYLNFNTTDNSGWLSEDTAGGHIEIECVNATCTKTTTISETGNREVRAGVFDSNDNLVGSYTDGVSFSVTDSLINKTAVLSFVEHGGNYNREYDNVFVEPYLGMDFKGSYTRNAIPFGNDGVIKFALQDNDNVVNQIEVNCDDGNNTNSIVATNNNDGTYSATCNYDINYYSQLSAYNSSLKQIKLSFSAVAVDSDGNEVSNKLTHKKDDKDYFVVYDYDDHVRQKEELSEQITDNEAIIQSFSDLNSESKNYVTNVVDQLIPLQNFILDKNNQCLWLDKNNQCYKYRSDFVKEDKHRFIFDGEDTYKYSINVQYSFSLPTTNNDTYPAYIWLSSNESDYPFEYESLVAHNPEHLKFLSILLTETFKDDINGLNGSNIDISSSIMQKLHMRTDMSKFKENLKEFYNENSQTIDRVSDCAEIAIPNWWAGIQDTGKKIYDTKLISGDYIRLSMNADGWAKIYEPAAELGYRTSWTIAQFGLGGFGAFFDGVAGCVEGYLTEEEREIASALFKLALNEGIESLSEIQQENLKYHIKHFGDYWETLTPEYKAIYEGIALGAGKTTEQVFIKAKNFTYKRINTNSFRIKLKQLSPIIPLASQISKRNGDNLNNIRIKGTDLISPPDVKKENLDYVADGNDGRDDGLDLKGTVTEKIMNNYFQKIYPAKDGYIFDDGKTIGNKGFDGVIYKQNSSGQITELIILDGKQFRNGTMKVNPEKVNAETGNILHKQLSNQWIKDKGKEMGNSLGTKIISFMNKQPYGTLEKYVGGLTRNSEFSNQTVPDMVIFKLSNDY
jgi:hypothetical protein